MNRRDFEISEHELRLIDRMSGGWRLKVVKEALEHSSLILEVLRLNEREQDYLKDILTLDVLGWRLTKAGEPGPGGIPVWEATRGETRIESTTRSSLIKTVGVSG